MYSYLFNTYEAVIPPPREEDITLDVSTSENYLVDNILKEDNIPTQHFNTFQNVSNELVPLPKEQINPFNNPAPVKAEEPKKSFQQKEIKLKSSKQFERAFQEACKINPEVRDYKIFLVKTAKRESGFNSHIQNQSRAPYYGYFQMGKNEIKTTTGLTVEQFRNDPVQQILGAVKLYKMNLATIKKLGVYQIGKQKGYSDDALVSGAWMGGPGGVKKYLLGEGDPSDSHWYKDGKGGSSVGKIMNNWKANEKG